MRFFALPPFSHFIGPMAGFKGTILTVHPMMANAMRTVVRTGLFGVLTLTTACLFILAPSEEQEVSLRDLRPGITLRIVGRPELGAVEPPFTLDPTAQIVHLGNFTAPELNRVFYLSVKLEPNRLWGGCVRLSSNVELVLDGDVVARGPLGGIHWHGSDVFRHRECDYLSFPLINLDEERSTVIGTVTPEHKAAPMSQASRVVVRDGQSEIWVEIKALRQRRTATIVYPPDRVFRPGDRAEIRWTPATDRLKEANIEFLAPQESPLYVWYIPLVKGWFGGMTLGPPRADHANPTVPPGRWRARAHIVTEPAISGCGAPYCEFEQLEGFSSGIDAVADIPEGKVR